MKKGILLVFLAAAGIAGYFLYEKNTSSTEQTEIKTDKITRGEIVLKIDCNGRVVSNFDVEIKSKASGEVIAFPFDISDKVDKGALILKLDPIDEERNVKGAQADLNIAVAQLKQMGEKIQIAQYQLVILQKNTREQITLETQKYEDAQRKVREAKKLRSTKVISDEEYADALSREIQAKCNLEITKAKEEEIKVKEIEIKNLQEEEKILQEKIVQTQIKLDTAQKRLQDTQIMAPMDGVVTEKVVQKGQIISSGISNVGGGTKILTLSDLSQIFVIASVDESDIGKVSLEQDVFITADAYPNIRFEGKVVQIGAKGINLNNVVTFEVKIEVLGGKRQRGEGSEEHRRGGMNGDRKNKRERAESSSDKTKEQAEQEGKDLVSDAVKDAKDQPKVDEKNLAENQNLSQDSSKDQKHHGKERMGRRSPEERNRVLKSLLKPEMTANISIIQDIRRNVLLVNSEAIIYDRATKKFKVEVLQNGLRSFREVEIGLNDGVVAEVIQGLEEDMEVILQPRTKRPGGGDSTGRMMRRMGR